MSTAFGASRRLPMARGRDSPTTARPSVRWTPKPGPNGRPDAAEIEERTVSQIDSTREHLIETYRKKAKHYDITSRFYPVPGYPPLPHLLRPVQAHSLPPADRVVDIACDTALN